MKRSKGQQGQLDFGEPPMPDPEACDFERKRLASKTCCTFAGRNVWTNCREVEHCIWDGWHQQGAPDAFCDEEDD